MDEINNQIYFLGNSRCFHTMDWYRSSEKIYGKNCLFFITDLIESEGHKVLINDTDQIFNLFNIDKLLIKSQSNFGNIYRNLIKLLLLPLQALILIRIKRKHKFNAVIAHTMYYMVLARLAGLKYVGTPQGSELLIRPYSSRFYKLFAQYGLNGASVVTVDSTNMREKAIELSNTEIKIVQNGIDIPTISGYVDRYNNRDLFLSIRGFSSLYQINELLQGRNSSNQSYPITLIYPFYEKQYMENCRSLLYAQDKLLGRIDKLQLYELLSKSLIVFSIPKSDSSPRSVYEAIFSGACVAIVYQKYYDTLPKCMKNRIIIVDLNDKNWFPNAIEKAKEITKNVFTPDNDSLNLFNQFESAKKVVNLYKDLNIK